MTREDQRVAIGQEFREIRQRLGMTQKQAGETLGLSQSYCGHLERGFAKLGFNAVSEALHCLRALEKSGTHVPELATKIRIVSEGREPGKCQCRPTGPESIEQRMRKVEAALAEMQVENRRARRELLERFAGFQMSLLSSTATNSPGPGASMVDWVRWCWSRASNGERTQILNVITSSLFLAAGPPLPAEHPSGEMPLWTHRWQAEAELDEEERRQA